MSELSWRILMATAVILATTSFAKASEEKEPAVKIYIMVGQSNMQGKGAVEGEASNTLRHLVQNDRNNQYQFLVDKDGAWRERPDVWIHYDSGPGNVRYGGLKPGYGSHGGVIGPELGFGHVIGDATQGRVLLIKVCWGGKSLGHDFLPPSAGDYQTPKTRGDRGFYYREILRLVDDVTRNIKTYFPEYRNQGIEIAGLCFHQGWNDQYGGLDERYEENLAAFIISDIRSSQHGLGVPDLPVVIATSGMIEKESLIKQGQLAMRDSDRYPQFARNVGVVDTEKPYGSQKMQFKFYTEKSPNKVGYHWNNHAQSYLNIGRAMAAEMQRLKSPRLPSRFAAVGTSQGVRLTWQLGTETPESVVLYRDGTKLDVEVSARQTTFVDAMAPPGEHDYELLLGMPSSENRKHHAVCDTSIAELQAHRNLKGVMLNWIGHGRYEGFQIIRDGKVIANAIDGNMRSYQDSEAPAKGTVRYCIVPVTGKTTPAMLAVNLGPADPGDALIYEPFDYPSDVGVPQSLLGKGGAAGTQGEYYYLGESKLERAPAAIGQGLRFGKLPVTGNRGSSHRWSPGCAIALDDGLRKAGLLDDGATLWISYVFHCTQEIEHRQGGGTVLLCSEDLKAGVGLLASPREYRTAVLDEGKLKSVRITSTRLQTPTLVVGKIVWGKDGESDTFVPYTPGHDLKQPEKHGRPSAPFNIDQTQLSRLVLQGEGQFDEIRVGPTYHSVIGRGTEVE